MDRFLKRLTDPAYTNIDIGQFALSYKAELLLELGRDERDNYPLSQTSFPGAPVEAALISRAELVEMLERADMASQVTLPIDKFRDLVLQAGSALPSTGEPHG